MQSVEFLDHLSVQFRGILRGEIRQPGVLGVLPHVLNGIRLRGSCAAAR